ncbi:response regulator transcription factor [Natronospirillum operosum]|uniref:Response regulator transcription factor n=1 Tax=Natronospirillum operosum TaxID=2759953 RepID=A0A4Z0WJY1_9GAMM|nr:response regulator transcription factor [Natronospirillum operosum]TGG95781.1 response regulator transcription factor [Natronospirillum operosum]
MIRVYIADDHSIVREGMRALISSAPDMDVVGEAPDGDIALQEVPSCQPAVLLMDMSMPGCSGLELIEKVRRRVPETRVLVLSMHREDLYATRTIRAGAHGFITKTRPPEEILDALRKVAAGQVYITAELANMLAMESITGSGGQQPHAQLTRREYDIFLDLARGMTVGDIARKLNVSSKTVSTHKARLMEKLEAGSISDLVRYALSQDLL